MLEKTDEIKLKNIKLIYEYDGTNFFGNQKNPGVRTVNEEIEKVLNEITGEEINLISAGRTDKGVHAVNQVSNFFTNSKIPAEKYKKILNRKLPGDINIKISEDVEGEFNARYSAKSRSYIYVIKNIKNYSAFERNYFTFVDFELDIERIKNIIEGIKGKYNFDNFRKSDCNQKNPEREIKEFTIKQEGDKYIFFIKADGFLKSMVRIIIGSVLAVYTGERSEDYIINKLQNPIESDSDKLVAPPTGLYLYEVEYTV